MSATAFKNAIRTREHRERAQPTARARFGLLEKHSDYVKRARNYHEKEKRISVLKSKAENRNPDEFYFGMVNKKTKVSFS
jgi:U3 small nucleolar RNA-associated protein 11